MEDMFEILAAMFGDNIEIKKASALEETVPDMLSNDYKKRFKAEYKQTSLRFQRLTKFLRKLERGEEKCTCPITLLVKQHEVMEEYLKILRTRAAIERVNLSE